MSIQLSNNWKKSYSVKCGLRWARASTVCSTVSTVCYKKYFGERGRLRSTVWRGEPVTVYQRIFFGGRGPARSAVLRFGRSAVSKFRTVQTPTTASPKPNSEDRQSSHS